MHLVCSNKPRPSVHKTGKGHQHWRRDIHHVMRDGKQTLCNIDASEWLDMGAVISDATSDPNLCKRCRAALQ